MDLGLKDRRALVLGASSGLGRAIAGALAHEGARVAICARGEERLVAAAKAIDAAFWAVADLDQEGVVEALVNDVRQKLGGIDILVTNTGGPETGAFASITRSDWQIGFERLWLSAANAIQAVLRGMQTQKWGRIVLITSISAKEPLADLTISNALRAGLLGMANSLSREVAAAGVTVNAVLPGYTRTERLAELGIAESDLVSRIPAGRLGAPEELAAVVAFLCSTQAAYLTGQAIACDGGFLRGI